MDAATLLALWATLRDEFHTFNDGGPEFNWNDFLLLNLLTTGGTGGGTGTSITAAVVEAGVDAAFGGDASLVISALDRLVVLAENQKEFSQLLVQDTTDDVYYYQQTVYNEEDDTTTLQFYPLGSNTPAAPQPTGPFSPAATSSSSPTNGGLSVTQTIYEGNGTGPIADGEVIYRLVTNDGATTTTTWVDFSGTILAAPNSSDVVELGSNLDEIVSSFASVLGTTAPGNLVVDPLTDVNLTTNDLLRYIASTQTAAPTVITSRVETGTLTAIDDVVVIDVSDFEGGGGSVAIDIDVTGQTTTDTIELALEGRTSTAVDFRSYDINSDTFEIIGNTNESAAYSYSVAEYRIRLVSFSGNPTVNISIRAITGGALV